MLRSFRLLGARDSFDLVFSPEQEGAIGYLITWYINPRGEAGPPSVPFAFKII